MKRQKTIIGWSEYLDFPEWGIKGLKVKVDTGARTSALHVENLKKLEDDRVSFEVIVSTKKPLRKKVVTEAKKWARVKSSNGAFMRRCFVTTTIRLGTIEKEIDLTLVSRDSMLFRMLLGRKALEPDFIVDVAKRNLLGKPLKTTVKKNPL